MIPRGKGRKFHGRKNPSRPSVPGPFLISLSRTLINNYSSRTVEGYTAKPCFPKLEGAQPVTSVQVGHMAKREIGEFDFFLYPTWKPVHGLEGARHESNADKPESSRIYGNSRRSFKRVAFELLQKCQLTRLTAVENESTCMKVL